MKQLFNIFLIWILFSINIYGHEAKIWMKYEISFTSDFEYENPLSVKNFYVTFTSPTGKEYKVNGFWDGGQFWKVRFCPDELGSWSWISFCGHTDNNGLNKKEGGFECIENNSELLIYKYGSITTKKGSYQFFYKNGKPFFWMGCTAWNGALKSTDEEWEYYLNNRQKSGYNVIQLVTTQWRGCEKNIENQAAYEWDGELRINPEFFHLLDKKIDEVNEKGMVVAPIILWTLQRGKGKELNPGYLLPIDQAVKLAKYIVARYQGNQVIWMLGGDGNYIDEYESHWKEIGRQVFNDINHGLATFHPMGLSWVGEVYNSEEWYGFYGYQSSHSISQKTIDWINKGPMSEKWDKMSAKPFINLEPLYENFKEEFSEKDVRNAIYWSLFATPVAGITYGANGIWPWLREGEEILNHRNNNYTISWKKSLDLPVCKQMSYLLDFFSQFNWWELYPSNDLIIEQSGNKDYKNWISLLSNRDNSLILIYFPSRGSCRLTNQNMVHYDAKWFNPSDNSYTEAIIRKRNSEIITINENSEDMILILTKK